MTEIPLHDRFFNPLDAVLRVTREGDDVTLAMDDAFVGREVEERYAVQELKPLVEGGRNDDALGLVLETEGEWITLLVGIGSGNERFAVDRARFAAALDD